MQQWWLWSAENSAIREPITQVITEIAINWDLCGQSQHRGQGMKEQRSDLWSLQVVIRRMNRRKARAGRTKVYLTQCPVSSTGQLQLPGEANKTRTNNFLTLTARVHKSLLSHKRPLYCMRFIRIFSLQFLHFLFELTHVFTWTTS